MGLFDSDKDKDAQKLFKSAYGVVFFIAGFNILLGFIALALKVEVLLEIGLGIFSIIWGIIFLVLGLFVRQRSRVALGFALALFILDSLFILFAGMGQKGTPPIGGLFVRIFFTAAMIRGFGAISQLNTIDGQQKQVYAGPRSVEPQVPPPQYQKQQYQPPQYQQQQYQPPQYGQYQPQYQAPPAPAAVPAAVPVAAPLQMRFEAFKCRLFPSIVRAIFSNGTSIELTWSEIGALAVRQMPNHQPWNGTIFLDILPLAAPGTAPKPIRVNVNTLITAANGTNIDHQPEAPWEAYRYLASQIVAHNPNIQMDAATAAFVREGQAPPAFISEAQFNEYENYFN